MNKSLNVFLSVLLCFVLCAGVLTSLYTTDDSASQHYQTEYTSSIPTGIDAPSVSFGVGANGDVLAVPMSSRRSSREQYLQPSRRSTGVADLQGFARSANSTGMLSLPSLQGGDGGRLFTHMSSSQTMKSFGGGSNAAGVSMSGGVVSTNNQSPIANRHLAMNPLPSSTALSQSNSSMLVLAQSSLQEIGATSVSSPNAPRGINGRRNAMGWGDGAEEWLNGIIGEGTGNGWMYESGGVNYFDESILYELYLAAVANGELPEGVSWEMFKQWFLRPNSGYSFPIPSGIWFMCFLALGYGLYIAYRRKQKVVNS